MERIKCLLTGRSLILITLIVIALLLGGCGDKDANVDENGEALNYTMDELETADRTGVFVKNEDGTFSPIFSDIPGYAGGTNEPSKERYLWFTDNTANVTKAIPTVTSKTPLVAIFNSSEEMPKEWRLEQYLDRGYTIGSHVYLDQDQSMYLDIKDMLYDSSANQQISALNPAEEMFRIEAVSGSDQLPIRNVDPNMSMLLGLEKNKIYRFEFYMGTKLTKVELNADTRIFQGGKITELKNPYRRTEDGFFYLNLPSNLENGYYYVENMGLFSYKRQGV